MKFTLPVFCMLAMPAFAECPTASDMASGVRLTDTYGDTETFYRLSEGLVRGEYIDGTGSGSQYLLHKGVVVIQVFDLENNQTVPNSRATYSYPDTMPPVLEAKRWDVEAMAFEDGDVTRSNESHIFGPMTEVTIGTCTYDMVPIISIYHDQDGYEESLNYLTDLGFAYLTETREQGQAPDIYSYVQIDAPNR